MCFVESGNPVLEVDPAHTRFLSKLRLLIHFRFFDVFIRNASMLKEHIQFSHENEIPPNLETEPKVIFI